MRRNNESDPKIGRFRPGPLFADLADPDLVEIAMQSTEARRPAGTSLIREGALGRQTLVVLSGTVQVETGGTIVATLGPGQIIGELAVLNGQPRSADVVAVTDVQLLVFDTREFFQLLERVPSFLERIGAVIRERTLERVG